MSRSTVFSARSRATALAACLASLMLTSASVAFAQQSVKVSENGGLLSIQANNTPAASLAEILSNELGISVVVTGDTEALINVDIVEEPLDKALAKLSPNHMLVRSDKQRDSRVVEVILMMGEGSESGSSGGDDQFLPSGSPADDIIISDEQPLSDDGALLRNPERSAEVRDAANGGTDPSSVEAGDPSSDGVPGPESFDPITGLPIDPLTGQPVQ